MKPNGAPGPDRLKRDHLMKGVGRFELSAEFLNLLFYTGYYPEAWRSNNTSMIPKEGKELNESGGWRPITVGNILECLVLY